MLHQKTLFLELCILCILCFLQCNAQAGPDPWNIVEKEVPNSVLDDRSIPPDLRVTSKKKPLSEINYANGEWFYRRILGIILKGGQVKKNEDGSIDISLQMKLNQKQWLTLDEYLQTQASLTEDMFRRSLGYIEQSIYEPSLSTKIILAWSDYIQMVISDYKMEIVYTLGALGASGLLFWIWNHMSHKNAMLLILIALYCYEVFISYKEAEQKEVDMFVNAINSCKWYVWSSKCEVPRPDPLIFIKHMNPMKIGIRMFTNIVSEPIISLSSVVKVMTHGLTDGLWYPFNVIFYGFLLTFFNILLLFFLIMIIFNFILNIPFNLSILGLVNVGLRQRHRVPPEDTIKQNQRNNHGVEDNNARNAQLLNMVLNVAQIQAQALNNQNRNVGPQFPLHNVNNTPRRQLTQSPQTMRRSASTGRLPDSNIFDSTNQCNVRRRNVHLMDGAGDAH